mmetsp:Transcript_14213/g.42318  ORF Transcript_14213/g.42318 Transcript_14213/m.42318 type:complete len:250 (+) Transcript_14213:209-958(+)
MRATSDATHEHAAGALVLPRRSVLRQHDPFPNVLGVVLQLAHVLDVRLLLQIKLCPNVLGIILQLAQTLEEHGLLPPRSCPYLCHDPGDLIRGPVHELHGLLPLGILRLALAQEERKAVGPGRPLLVRLGRRGLYGDVPAVSPLRHRARVPTVLLPVPLRRRDRPVLGVGVHRRHVQWQNRGQVIPRVRAMGGLRLLGVIEDQPGLRVRVHRQGAVRFVTAVILQLASHHRESARGFADAMDEVDGGAL